jgi:tetratricopeptide (TPR) repeat protein
LELRLRGEGRGFDRAATPFSAESLGSEQSAWVELLDSGRLPSADPSAPPSSYLVAPAWADRLEDSPADDWLTWLLRGVARHHAGDIDEAAAAWQRSLDAAPNAWALRNLAVVADGAAAADLLRRAVSLAPDQPALLVELLESLLGGNRSAEALEAVDAAPAEVREDPLVQFLEARAAVDSGAVERAEHVLAEVVMPWVREGSRSVDDLWYRVEAARTAHRRGVAPDDALLSEVRRTAALPYAYDFRMSAGPPVEPEP